jgi:hypothetical protein
LGDIERKLTQETQKLIDVREKAAAAHAQMFGLDLIAKANDYAKTLGNISNITKLSTEKKEELRKAVTAALDAYTRLGRTAPDVLEEIYRATTPALKSTLDLTKSLTPLRSAIEGADADVELMSGSLHDLGLATNEADRAFREWAMRTGATYAPAIVSALEDITDATDSMGESMGSNIVDGLGDTLRTQLGPTILAAVTGGGSVLKSIGSLIGKNIGDSIVGSFSESFGKSGLGQVLSSVIPGIGALLGPLLGKIGDLFGVSKEVKQAREELEKYQETLRGMLTTQQRAEAAGRGWAEDLIAVRDAFLAVGRSAEDAERIVAQMWDTDNPDAMRRAIEEINEVFEEIDRNAETASGIFDELVAAVEATGERIPDAFLPVIDQLVQMRMLTEEQADALRDLAGEPSWQQMEAAAKALGIDVAQIGKGFDSKKLQSSAQEMLKNFNILRAGGMDVGTMLVATRDQMSKMVREAIALGTELPEGLREYIEELSRSGQLVDENGNALKDLSRLNFAEPLEKSVSNLIKKFEELINLLLNGVVPALGSLPIPGDIRIPRGAGDGSPVLPGEPPLLPPRPGTGERGEFGGTTSTTNTTTNLGVAVVQVAAGASEEEITQAIIRSLPRQVAGNFMGVGVGLREALDIA